MGLGGRIHMRTEALMTLTQWLSPNFPIGAFSYSHGLEAAIDLGDVTDAKTLEAWLSGIISDGSGRNDVIMMRAAYDGGDLDELNDLACALCPSKERLAETKAQGAAFSKIIASVWGNDFGERALPVILGAAAAKEGIELRAVAQLYLQGFAGNLIAASQRLLPLGHSEAQACLSRMSATICETVTATEDQTLADLGGAVFASDIASMRHETLYSRFFQS